MLKVKSGYLNGAASEWEPIDVTEQDIRLSFNRLFTEDQDKIDGFVKSHRCCHCERSEAISLAVTA